MRVKLGPDLSLGFVLLLVLWLGCTKPERNDSGTGLPEPGESRRAAPLETARFPWSGLSLELPAAWKRSGAEPWVTFHTADGTVEVRLWSHEAGDPQTLAGHREKILASEAKLARTVKESQYHALRREEPFKSAGGLEGWWALYGHGAASPSRLAYYLVDGEGRLISVEVRFSSFETEPIWGRYDQLIRQGLRPAEP